MPISRLNSFTTQKTPANGGRGSGLAKDLPIGATLEDVRQAQRSQGQLNNSPPKAPAAPTGNTGYTFVGLAEALNTYQNDLVKKQIYSIADIYEFEFDPPPLGASKVKKPGSTDKTKTAGQNPSNANQALNPGTNRVNNNSQNWSVEAGTQILQLIDQVMRSSDYVSLQANARIDPNTQQASPSTGTGTGITAWYNVTVQATSLGHDPKRQDFAYRLHYKITPYAISKMASQFFPDSRYRGSHKSYNYWFTGKNTQIISFEQKYDALYKLILSSQIQNVQQTVVATRYDKFVYSKTAMPTTEQKTGQQTDPFTNAPADSAADFLYSPTDYSVAKVRIVGDPAWMQQGSVTTGILGPQFGFGPFNADGSINYDSQSINFDISWNTPQDYDLSTGVMNVTNSQGRPRVNNTYVATECRSFFSRGKFEQELEGKFLIENKPSQVASTQQVARPGAKQQVTPPGVTTDTPNVPNNVALAGIVGSSTQNNAFVGYRSPRSAAVRRSALYDPYDSVTTINPLNPNSYGSG
jgi:hypothetical protein